MQELSSLGTGGWQLAVAGALDGRAATGVHLLLCKGWEALRASVWPK